MPRGPKCTERLSLLDFFFLCLVGGNAKGTQEPLVVGADLEVTAIGRPRALLRRRADLRKCARRRAIHEPDHRLERHFHLEPRGPGSLAAGLDPWIFGYGGSNGIG